MILISGNFDMDFLLSDKQIMNMWMRTILFIRGESEFLTNLFKKSITDVWLATMGLKAEILSEEDKVDLHSESIGSDSKIDAILILHTPFNPGGISLRKINISVFQYHFTAQTHVGCCSLLTRKK